MNALVGRFRLVDQFFPSGLELLLKALEDRRVAMVTGGARGIGRGCAHALAKRGHAVALVDVLVPEMANTRTEIEAMGVPCLTLRDNTERPVTIEQGTNELVGTTSANIIDGFERSRDASRAARIPELWDGRAGERIADKIIEWHKEMSVRR